MWKSLVDDMFRSTSESCRDNTEKAILGLHLYNVALGYQCVGLMQDDPEDTSNITPTNWNLNSQIYSFKYRFKRPNHLLLKAIRNSQGFTLHAVRTEFNDRIFTWAVNLQQFSALIQTENISKTLSESLIQGYQREILKKLKNLDPPNREQGRTNLLEDRRSPYQPNIGIPSNPLMPMQPSNPFGGIPAQPFPMQPMPGGLMGPQHPMFGQQPRLGGVRWDPINPHGMPEFPDHFAPPGGNQFRGPPNGFIQ